MIPRTLKLIWTEFLQRDTAVYFLSVCALLLLESFLLTLRSGIFAACKPALEWYYRFGVVFVCSLVVLIATLMAELRSTESRELLYFSLLLSHVSPII